MLKIFLVTGGMTGSDTLDSTEIYDPDIGSWKAGAVLPIPMRNLRASSIDNRILIFGMTFIANIKLVKVKILY